MRIAGHGIDMVEVGRIGRTLERHGQRFLDRCFTAAEAGYASNRKRRNEHLAARFAAKEAVFKALGTGWRSGMAWTDVEIVPLPSGAPTVRLTGEAAKIAGRNGVAGWIVSLTHTADHAMASVIAVGS